MPVPDIIRALALAADPPKRSGSPKKSGKPETIVSEGGKPLLKVEAVDRKGLKLTLLPHAGGTRAEAEAALRSEEHTSELQSLMRISYAVFCLKKKKQFTQTKETVQRR